MTLSTTAGCTVIMQRGLDDYSVRDRHAAHSEGHGVGAAACARYNLLCSLGHTIPHISHCTYDNAAASTHTCAGYVHEAFNPRKDGVTSVRQVQVWQPCKKEQGCWGWGGGGGGGDEHADWLVALGEQLGGLQAQMQTTASTSSLQAVQHESTHFMLHCLHICPHHQTAAPSM